MSTTETASNPSVPQIILQQLGGRLFCAMTGAKDFVSIEEGQGLQFKLPNRFAKNGINTVRILLRWDDVYDVEYGRVHGFKYKALHTSEGLYFDDLQPNFTEVTGLSTSM